MTTRRDALLALPLLCAASSAGAQAPKAGPPKRLGYLALDSDPKTPRSQNPFLLAMNKKGWALGENLMVESAFADWQSERLAALADELVRKRVDVIFCNGDLATLAAARATRTIPIVFQYVPWPVEQGVIESYARPGRNVTGQAFYTGQEVTNKGLQFFREIAPAVTRLSCMTPANTLSLETLAGGRVDMFARSHAAAKSQGIELRCHPLDRPQDIDAVFADVTAWRAQAVSALGATGFVLRQRIAEFALQHRLPSASDLRFFPEAGGLFSFGPAWSEVEFLGGRIVEYIDRILRGTPPAGLPVDRPSRYELVINAKTAKALGLTVPQSLLVRADEVIQ